MAQFEFPLNPNRRGMHKDSDWRLASCFRPSKAATPSLEPPNPPCQGGFRFSRWRRALTGRGSIRFPPDKGGKGDYIPRNKSLPEGVRRQGRFETEATAGKPVISNRGTTDLFAEFDNPQDAVL